MRIMELYGEPLVRVRGLHAWPRWRKLDGPRPLSPYELLTGERFHDHHTRDDVIADRTLVAEGWPRGRHPFGVQGSIPDLEVKRLPFEGVPGVCAKCGGDLPEWRSAGGRPRKFCGRCGGYQRKKQDPVRNPLLP